MSAPPRKPKPLWVGAVFVAMGMAILIGLGTWQMQRLAWKTHLLARIERLQGAVPVPLAMVADTPAAQLDFTRVRVDCPDLQAPALQLYSIADGDAGVRLIEGCKVGGKVLLVDTGFMQVDMNLAVQGEPVSPAVQRAREDERRWRNKRPSEPLVGVLRIPSKKNRFTPPNNPASGIWYWMDIPAMAAVLFPSQRSEKMANQALPVVLMLERPQVSAATPAPLPKEISNRHLEYALTWYGLAAALAGVYIALLLRRRTP